MPGGTELDHHAYIDGELSHRRPQWRHMAGIRPRRAGPRLQADGQALVDAYRRPADALRRPPG
jgi:hypothetical protein